MSPKGVPQSVLRLIRARWVAPEPDVLIRDGAVLCRNSRVIYCGYACDIEAPANAKVVDLGNAVLLPGFINAHTHLELSGMAGRLSGAGGFVPWLRAMLDQWNTWADEQYVDSVRRGFRECLDCGVTCVGNIASRPQADPVWIDDLRLTIDDCNGRIADCGLRIADCEELIADYAPQATIFHEVIGLNPEEAEMRLQVALARRPFPEPEPPAAAHSASLRYALSPHAPYSVSPQLLRMCFDRAARLHEPICIHAAETREEEEFTLNGSGPIAEFLGEKGVLPRDWKPPRRRPLEYLADNGLGESPALVAHANYANEDEIRWMAAHEISVAFCPPSHCFFGHEPYPLRAMIERGVNLCIATDSLASAASLDVMSALRQAREMYRSHVMWPEVSAARWLKMITVNPARALGWQNELGALRPEMAADMVAYEVPADCAQPLEFLLNEEPPLTVVWIAGERAR